MNTKDMISHRFKSYTGVGVGVSVGGEISDQSTSQLEGTYMRLIVTRTMMIFFLCVLQVPFFMDSLYTSPTDLL